MTELKPCPFCGASGITTHIYKERDTADMKWQYQVVCDYNLGGCGGSGCFSENPKDAIDAWNRRAAFTTAHSEWINVKDRLPEEYKDVLCYYEYFRYGDFNCMFRTIDRGYYGNGIWGGEAGQGLKNKVLAWMPLPEPPKEET